MLKFFWIFITFSFLYSGVTGKIKGRITHKVNGEPLAGCNVFLKNTDYGTASDVEGNFVIYNVSPGDYNIHAQMIGFGESVISNVRVNIDFTTNTN